MVMTVIAWAAWLIIGAVIGAIAGLIQRRNYALVTNILFGMLGAFVGGMSFDLFGFPTITDFNPSSIFAALAGAILLLVLLHALKRRRVVAVREAAVTNNAVMQPDDRREELYESEFTVDRRRIPIWVPVVFILLLPILHVVLLRVRILDISAIPAPFGTVSTYSSEQGTLDYLVYTPPTYQQGAQMPLLLFLHGCMQDPYQLEFASGMRAIADQNNFMIAYPQQNAASSPHRCWNWYDDRNQQRDSGEPTLLFGIVNQVRQNYSVEPNRIYVAGISSGGAMTSILASCYRDVFAAAFVHSGMAYDASNSPIEAITAPLRGSETPPDVAGANAYACAGDANQPIPVLILHGTADTVVVPQNAHDALEQFAQTNDYADDDTDNDSVIAQPATTETLQVADGHTYTVEHYDYNGERLMQRYMVDGMWHMWSGGTGILPFSDPAAPNASQIMWDFFSAHSQS
ncbi:MAG: PHB depolymerase family esterase [Chloroflexota bacterium]|nr:PHB depolymerase family esterase [Chloroflexota bacterium]